MRSVMKVLCFLSVVPFVVACGGDDDGAQDGPSDGGLDAEGSGGRGGGDGSVDRPDGEGTGGGDNCSDVANACSTPGRSCDGDTLVECAEAEDGCFVATRTDCTSGIENGFCDSAANPPACGERGPCEGLGNACKSEGVNCEGNTLVRCARNDDGCLVTTRTNCAAGETDYCDDEADPPACAVDPCARLENPCDEEGVRCDRASIVTCEENEDGCLEETTVDCTEDDDNNTCEEGDDGPECAFDPCRDEEGALKENVCVEDETSCVDDVLVECIEDDDGCLIAHRTPCTSGGNNFCNAEAEPPACDFDPCIGVTNCLEAGTTCRGTNLVVCGPDSEDCLVEDIVDCTQGGTVAETCDDSGEVPACVECVDDSGCEDRSEGDTSCSENRLRTCTDTDGDTCLNLVTEECGDDFTCSNSGCTFSGDAECDSEISAVFREAGSFGSYDTEGAGNDFNVYTCPGLIIPFQAQAPDLLFALDVRPGMVATVTLTNPEGFDGNGAWMNLLSECADGENPTAEAGCEVLSNTTLEYANETDAMARVYFVVDAEGADNTGEFGLEIDVRALDCGDASLDGSEECDDGNIFSGDGCTPSCTLEEGYACTGNSPSVCTRRPEDGICGNTQCAELPEGAPAGTEVCCTRGQTCGVAYPLFYGAGCFERGQSGAEDDECPDEPSVFGGFFRTFTGCCRPDNRCGLTSATGWGCAERTEVWLNMQDGFGSFLYDGPFEAISCGEEE